MNIPFHIADHSLTFFVNKGSYTVADDNSNFEAIRRGLMEGSLGAERLMELADIRVALAKSLNGRLALYGNAVLFDGAEIANVWVDKLIGFNREGLPIHAIVEALASLCENPSETARARLPVFVEQSQLGFLPDGRIAALKVVGPDFLSRYKWAPQLDNTPGQIVTMERADVNPNPDLTCESGLHLGAYAYLPSYGLNEADTRVVLCAFWPRDVVAVPVDYSGQKIRVCRYEVLEELDKDQLKDFISANELTINKYWTSEEPEIVTDEDLETFENMVTEVHQAVVQKVGEFLQQVFPDGAPEGTVVMRAAGTPSGDIKVMDKTSEFVMPKRKRVAKKKVAKKKVAAKRKVVAKKKVAKKKVAKRKR